MTLKLGNIFFITVMVIVVLVGCGRAPDMVADTTPPTDATMDDAMTEMTMETGSPMKFVLLIDYPEGGKDAYIAWVASVVPTLQAPKEVARIRSYDNEDPEMSPNRLVEFDFKSFLDMATYLNRPEIAAILENLPNHATDVTAHTFIQRSDYSTGEEGDWMVKSVYFINYPFSGKQAYLDWVASIAPLLTDPPQLKTITAYDNYYGESPHRLVELEFANQVEVEAYAQLADIMAIETELDNKAGSWVKWTFALRSDYIKK
ncbi:MAG: hypothetical protein OXI63_09405 [Candidatus Poribacteria bacterium]|nr:hypothetical protein [Candidatus Poribacteria bacterium]